jgi:hypothetical protein
MDDRAGTFKHARITSEDRRKAVLGALTKYGIPEDKISPELLDTFIADATNAGRGRSSNPKQYDDAMATTEAETALEQAEINEAIRDKSLEDYDKNIDAMQRHLGVQKGETGLFGIDFEKVSGMEELESHMQETDPLDIQGLVAVSGDNAAVEAMKNVYAKSGRKGSFAEFLGTSEEQKGKLSAEAQKALGIIGKRGARGIAGAGIMTREIQQRATSGAARGEGGEIIPEELLKKESAYAPSGPGSLLFDREKAAGKAGETEFGDIVQNHFGPAAENLLKATQQFAKANEEGKAWWQLMDRG